METSGEKTVEVSNPNFDTSHDVIVTDEEGDRIAAMREYVFLNVATACN